MSGELTGYKGEIVGSPEYFIELNNRNFMECVAEPLSTHKHYVCVKKLAGSINRILLEVLHDLQESEQIRYCVHPDWWDILFELLSDLDNIVKMVGGSSSYEKIFKLVESGSSGGKKVSEGKINKLRAIKAVISNQYSSNHADIVVRELRKGVRYGIAGITDIKLRKALSNVYKDALQGVDSMEEQEFWEGLLAMYMYCSTDFNYNRYFKGFSNILICSENYFFYIVERAIGRRWTYEDNHFFVELKNDFIEILGIVQGDLQKGIANGDYLEQENADALIGFFDDLETLGFSVDYGRGLLEAIKVEETGNSISFDDAIKRALLLTFAFEGSSYTVAAGNFDGQGISFGLLQWNIGQGTLQPLLQQMDSNHNQAMKSIFGIKYNSISTMLSLSKTDQLKWATSINDSNNALLSAWAQSFTALGNTSEFQAIQQKALNDYIIQAERIYNDFGLTTERGVALAFDIAVQNWSVKAGNSIVNNSMTEFQKLSVIANSVALQSAPTWQQDVLNRKMTIVNGTGTVHGKNYNLSYDYNIADRIIKK